VSYLPTNIRLLRKKKGLTQAAFATKIGVNRSVVGAYEEGRADPRVKTLINISHYFKVGIDDLLKKDLGQSEIDTSDYLSGQLRVLPIAVDTADNEELVTLVGQKAAAGYLNGFADQEYIESLPLFRIPFTELPRGKTYRMFQIQGESMLPIPSSSVIIANFVETAQELKEGHCYVFITRDDGVVYKRLRSIDPGNGTVVLGSDNPEFEPIHVAASDLVEIWYARGFVSLEIPREGDFQPDIRELSRSVIELKEKVEKISAT
jgi:transcriptional regulator with XRE-family HTH domain